MRIISYFIAAAVIIWAYCSIAKYFKCLKNDIGCADCTHGACGDCVRSKK